MTRVTPGCVETLSSAAERIGGEGVEMGSPRLANRVGHPTCWARGDYEALRSCACAPDWIRTSWRDRDCAAHMRWRRSGGGGWSAAGRMPAARRQCLGFTSMAPGA